jgi:predicted metal-binding membrane protein
MAMSPAMRALEMVAMMVAMMLPSLAAAAWGFHRWLRAMQVSRAAQRTTLLSIGYTSVWSVIGLALFVSDIALSPARMASPAESRLAPWTVGAVMVCAGLVQRSRWKANQLLRCRHEGAAVRAIVGTVMTALLDGYRLGAACALSCAAPMAVLIAAGLMDTRMMLVITAAISAERVAPGGARIARFTGTITLVAGLAMCLRAINASVPLS